MLATDVRELSHNGNSVRGADASLVAHGDSGTDTDEVLKALGELDDVLKENAERERVLFQRIAEVRAEGQSIPSIAHLFGVTHQRVSNLLRRVAQGGNTITE